MNTNQYRNDLMATKVNTTELSGYYDFNNN